MATTILNVMNHASNNAAAFKISDGIVAFQWIDINKGYSYKKACKNYESHDRKILNGLIESDLKKPAVGSDSFAPKAGGQ